MLRESRPRMPGAKLLTSRHFAKLFNLYVNDTPPKRRWRFNLCILTLLFGIPIGYNDVTTYFLNGEPLCFNEVQVGFYVGAFL